MGVLVILMQLALGLGLAAAYERHHFHFGKTLQSSKQGKHRMDHVELFCGIDYGELFRGDHFARLANARLMTKNRYANKSAPPGVSGSR